MNRYLLIALFLTLSIFSSSSYASSEDEEDILPFKPVERVNPFRISSTEFGFSASPEVASFFKSSLFSFKEITEKIENLCTKTVNAKQPLLIFANGYFGANFPMNQYFSIGFKPSISLDAPFCNKIESEIQEKSKKVINFLVINFFPIFTTLKSNHNIIKKKYSPKNYWQYKETLSKEEIRLHRRKQ